MYFKYTFKHNVSEIKLVFRNYDKIISMKRNIMNPFLWDCNIDLKEGVYLYKFAINSLIRLNDPTANEYICDEQGEVWSVIRVNSINNISSSSTAYILKAELQVYLSKYAIINTELHCDKDIHSISLMWHQGNGKMIKFEEFCLHTMNNSLLHKTYILDTSSIPVTSGLYRVIIFIDGEQIYTNYFQMIKHKNDYMFNQNHIDIAI